jgi:hypothetical protein
MDRRSYMYYIINYTLYREYIQPARDSHNLGHGWTGLNWTDCIINYTLHREYIQPVRVSHNLGHG